MAEKHVLREEEIVLETFKQWNDEVPLLEGSNPHQTA
jgi:hypothetical protein